MLPTPNTISFSWRTLLCSNEKYGVLLPIPNINVTCFAIYRQVYLKESEERKEKMQAEWASLSDEQRDGVVEVTESFNLAKKAQNRKALKKARLMSHPQHVLP